MYDLIIMGAGRIGRAMAALLQDTGQYRITLTDRDPAALARVDTPGVATRVLEATDGAALRALMAGKAGVVGAGPFAVNPLIAEAARDADLDYYDVTEDVAVTTRIRALAEGAKGAFVPQCGLAPGVISIVAHDLASRFDQLRDLKLRVGALPRYPTNALGYNLTWSTEGLINEYLNPCDTILNGARTDVPPMEQLEHFALDGIAFEAFNTSGGVGSLTETYEGKVENLSYKTIRYPGHCAAMRLLLDDLALRGRRDLLKEILEGAIPQTRQDVVVVFVTATGMADGHLTQTSFARMIEGRELAGRSYSAIEITTASAACAIIDLKMLGKLPERGFVRQEEVRLGDFLENRFGQVYA